MSGQVQGLAGAIVAGMIHRSVRRRFHSVHLRVLPEALPKPVVLYANHHGWMDGYLAFELIQKLGIQAVDWIEEFDVFPLFAKVGGLRFAKGDSTGRAATILKTIRLMRDEQRSLLIFPEGVLHRPPEVYDFGRALAVVAQSVPDVQLVPVAILTEMSLHERPEAWIQVGEPHRFASLADCRERLVVSLENLTRDSRSGARFELLIKGTPDVNERFSMRSLAQP